MMISRSSAVSTCDRCEGVGDRGAAARARAAEGFEGSGSVLSHGARTWRCTYALCQAELVSEPGAVPCCLPRALRQAELVSEPGVRIASVRRAASPGRASLGAGGGLLLTAEVSLLLFASVVSAVGVGVVF